MNSRNTLIPTEHTVHGAMRTRGVHELQRAISLHPATPAARGSTRSVRYTPVKILDLPWTPNNTTGEAPWRQGALGGGARFPGVGAQGTDGRGEDSVLYPGRKEAEHELNGLIGGGSTRNPRASVATDRRLGMTRQLGPTHQRQHRNNERVCEAAMWGPAVGTNAW